ncbi:MAG: endolytic transglycosylase MltG [Myxococcales bacterium]|nr:endolytic transglycosylase MltG [Myxococcales bacterium]USN50410.1 MAG: endolytic transglycosylase MltG [Myxococcales bacterium]
MHKHFLRIFFIAFLLVALSSGLIALIVKSYLVSFAKHKVELHNVIVEIPYGSSLRSVVRLLASENVIPSEKKFYWYMRLARNDADKIQAGYYQFDGVYSLSQLAESLKYGRNKAFPLVFREGESLVDLVESLEIAGIVNQKEFIEAMTSSDVLNLIGAPNSEQRKELKNDVGGIEGYLFPDTYFFTKKDSPKAIISIMYRRMVDKIDESIKDRMKEVGMSLHQVLTLAAIVEKEAGEKSEKPIIASVYLNRLHKGMRLQADPTVIYGLKNYNGKIHKSDLLGFHSYNTYKIVGLPPGPIASPGIEAIKAVLWPATTNYLYFVSKNDGTHVFCENLSCHNKAVKKWQIDYFKSAQKEKIRNKS